MFHFDAQLPRDRYMRDTRGTGIAEAVTAIEAAIGLRVVGLVVENADGQVIVASTDEHVATELSDALQTGFALRHGGFAG